MFFASLPLMQCDIGEPLVTDCLASRKPRHGKANGIYALLQTCV